MLRCKLIPFWGLAISMLATCRSSGDEVAATVAIEKAGGHVRRIAQDVEWNEISFHLSTSRLSDEVLQQLAAIPEVRWLSLQGTTITDEQLRYISTLTKLTRLHLEKTAIGDAGLAHLAPLNQLEYLNIYGTKVTDGGIEQLAQLSGLKQLYVWQTGITEEGMARLRELLPSTAIVGAAKIEPVPPPEPVDEPVENQPAAAFATGQFVRIELPGEDRFLHVAEVEILEADTAKPLHTGGKATQSSTDFQGDAPRAVDGKTDQSFGSNSVSHTAREANPWWEVDLGSARPIGRIRIWNRGDCCGERLAGAKVLVLDADRKEVAQFTIEIAETGSRHEFPTAK